MHPRRKVVALNCTIIKTGIKEKFDRFSEQGRILFFSAACGFGKTTVAKELLKSKRVLEISIEDDFNNLLSGRWDFLLIDNLQDLRDEDKQQTLLSVIRESPGKRFVFLSRGTVPGWLIPFQVSGLLSAITYKEMFLDRNETAVLFEKSGIHLSEVELTRILNDTRGYPLALSVLIQLMSDGTPYRKELITEVREKLFIYYEDAIFKRFEMPMRRFLLSLALFDEINPEIAKLVSGDCNAVERLTYIYHNTCMIGMKSSERFRFWHVFRNFLRREMQKEYSDEQIRMIYSRGGLYYELHENYGKALEFYSKSGDCSKVSELIIKSIYLHPGMGHYEELESYFELLSDEQILVSPALMQGMSMLRALQGNYEESDRWYGELKNFITAHDKSDEAAKEAKSRLIYLDIALPQRGVDKIVQIMSTAATLITNKEIKLTPFSVTSALPSIMNGGKDFSKWSKTDDLLYATMRKPVELVLGKDGIGLADCAIAESKFEKGKDISEQILELVSKLNEIQHKGTPDIEFAVVGLLARSQIFAGYAEATCNTVSALKSRFADQKLTRFFPNIDALLCRISLRTGNMMYVDDWYNDKAPKNAVTVKIMKRYLYLTQAMTELAYGNDNAALLTLAPLEPLFDACGRHIDMIHLKTISAAAKFRKGDNAWRDDIKTAVDISAEYGFIRPISGYGVSALQMLEEYEYSKNKKFTEKLIRAARTHAVCYPDFLLPAASRHAEKLTEAELQVLRLLCADKSNAEISRILNIQLTTVKSHISHILQKLGAKRRAEAKTIAQNLRII